MKLPQLSLRDLFWLVALVALGCGWWVHSRQLQRSLVNQRRLVESFASVLTSLECKIEPDAGGFTKVTIPYNISTGMLGATVPVPFKELQETLDDRSIWIGARDGIDDSRQP